MPASPMAASIWYDLAASSVSCTSRRGTPASRASRAASCRPADGLRPLQRGQLLLHHPAQVAHAAHRLTMIGDRLTHSAQSLVRRRREKFLAMGEFTE